VIISLVTGAISVANASAFILLNPGPELAQYLSASAIYSVFVWTNLWIIPSTWGFLHEKIATVRQTQLFLALVGGGCIIAAHFSLIGFVFSILLMLDTFIFYSYPLLYDKNTLKTQKIDLLRACLAVVSLSLALLGFAASPAMFVLLLAGFTALMAAGLRLSGWHRAPVLSLNAAPFKEILHDLSQSFRQKSLLAFLAGRFIEIGMLLILGSLNQLSALISFKLGLSISNTLSSNALRYRPTTLFLVLNGLYGLAFASIFALELFVPTMLPKSLATVDMGGAALALPIVNLCFAAILFGIRNR
jgi:hypothetical protein